MLRVLTIAATLPLIARAADVTPSGWHLSGSEPQSYVVALDRTVFHSGAASGSLLATSTDPGGFGTLMQMAQPGRLAGNRVKYTAFVRADGVRRWAGLWLRVDAPDSPTPMAFDNMQGRSIKGDTDWTSYSIVLDVPEEASALAYGILLDGPGQVWIDEARIEIVDRSTPVTAGLPPGLPAEPSNLGFEQ